MRRGASAVEFALVLPVMTLFVAGIIEFGWFITQTLDVSRAARDASRYGASVYEARDVPPGTLSIPAAESFAREILDGAGVACGEGCSVQARVETTPFETVTVEITAPYEPLFGMVTLPHDIRGSFMTAVEAQ